MSIALWAFDIRQELLLENIKPLVTPLIDGNRPNIVPITNLLSFLPKIECDRLLQFRFEDDMRRALIGRLMIHAFFVAHHGCRWDELVFSRSATNKPILVEPNHLRGISFNISHHGNWVILAGNTSLKSTLRLGIDVMDFQEQVPGESFENFFSCFKDQFTAKEAAFLRDAPSDPNAPDSHLRRFYRMWCLKEAIVKALGVGIDFDLTSFEFTINEAVETLEPISSTGIQVHARTPDFPQEGWSIEEGLLDQDHCYAVAAQTDIAEGGKMMDGSGIKRLNWAKLLKDAVPYPN